MDKLDFAAHIAAYNRETTRRIVPYLLLLVLALFATLMWLPRGHVNSDSPPYALLPFFGTLIIFIMAALRITKRALQKHHLTCPFCNRVWSGEASSQIVMGTGNCGHCGSRVLTQD